jgi:hypothetical protein
VSATVLPLAHHPLVTALPFVVPMLLIVGGLCFLAMRDRIGRRADSDAGEAPRSQA